MNTQELRYLEILDLRPGASFEEIKRAYHDLVWVWHPDRFPNNHRLQEKAHTKLQAINEAYDYLKAHSDTQFNHSKTKSSFQTNQKKQEQSAKQKTSWEKDTTFDNFDYRDYQRPPHDKRTRRRLFFPYYAFIQLGMVIGILVLGVYIYSGALMKSTVIKEVDLPEIGFFSNEKEWSNKDTWFNDKFFKEETRTNQQSPGRQQIAIADHNKQAQEKKPATLNPNALNVGSNKSSTPTSPSPKPAIDAAKTIATPSLQSFTLGSSKQEVRAAQGEPERIYSDRILNYEIWQYGKSIVKLSGKEKTVVAWNNEDGNLNLTMDAVKSENYAESFDVGAHKDLVLQLHGIPDKISNYPSSGYQVWRYGYSSIVISSNTKRVLDWSNVDNNLKVNAHAG